jgi:hypothetical protein
VVLEDEEVVTTTWYCQGDRADFRHPPKLPKCPIGGNSIYRSVEETCRSRATAYARSSAAIRGAISSPRGIRLTLRDLEPYSEPFLMVGRLLRGGDNA